MLINCLVNFKLKVCLISFTRVFKVTIYQNVLTRETVVFRLVLAFCQVLTLLCKNSKVLQNEKLHLLKIIIQIITIYFK